MTQEVEITVGIPDYYRDDQMSEELDKYIEDLLVKTNNLGVSIPFYVMEFCE